MAIKDALRRAAAVVTGGTAYEKRAQLVADEEQRRTEHAVTLAAHKAQREADLAHLAEHERLQRRALELSRGLDRMVRADQEARGQFERAMEQSAPRELVQFIEDLDREIATLQRRGDGGEAGPLAVPGRIAAQARITALLAVRPRARALLTEAIEPDELSATIAGLRAELDTLTEQNRQEREAAAATSAHHEDLRRRGLT